MNEYASTNYALAYLEKADQIPHRKEGEAVLLEVVSHDLQSFLDLGTGDGRLIALLKANRPQAYAIGLDSSPAMLEAARKRFQLDATVEIIEHDLEMPLPALRAFDAIVSSFAIHHCEHARKRELYAEVFATLAPGGIFCNLEHVSSPTDALHLQFLHALGATPEAEDPSNKCLDVETQLDFLREVGFVEVDCLWKWRELALLVGSKAAEE